MDDLTSAQYCIAMQNPEPSNYTRVPNIIDHLTYDEIDEETGVTKVKRLSIYAKELYRILKTIAGQENICWRNTENLAQLANMSKGQVSNCKKELQNKFHQLDGTSLIQITERKKESSKNSTIYHQVTIMSIWGFNRAYFLLKKIEKKIEKEARSPDERANQARSPDERAPLEARSLSERTNIYNKTSLCKEQHSTAAPSSVCSSDQENSVDEAKVPWFNFLLKVGYDIFTATSIIEKYSIEEIKNSANYTDKKQLFYKSKNEILQNPLGYLIKTLENKWWKVTC